MKSGLNSSLSDSKAISTRKSSSSQQYCWLVEACLLAFAKTPQAIG
jgi:hypothetical protein